MNDDEEEKGPEHRSSDRIQLALEIHYRSAGAFLISYSVNLSRGGLFIESDSPLPTGTPIELRLNTPDAQMISLKGHVAWVRLRGDTESGMPSGMGIAVQTPEDRYGALVDQIASRFTGIKIMLAIGAGHQRARAMLHRHLAAVVDCQVIDVEDPYVDAGSTEGFDLALVSLDWIHGEQILVNLRDTLGQMPIIVMGRNPATREHGIGIGATAALESPPSFPDLRAAVIAALARPSSVAKG